MVSPFKQVLLLDMGGFPLEIHPHHTGPVALAGYVDQARDTERNMKQEGDLRRCHVFDQACR